MKTLDNLEGKTGMLTSKRSKIRVRVLDGDIVAAENKWFNGQPVAAGDIFSDGGHSGKMRIYTPADVAWDK